MTEIQKLKLIELKKFREALLPLGYWVYSMSGAGEDRITICARKPEDEQDWFRLRHIEARENSALGQQMSTMPEGFPFKSTEESPNGDK